MADKPEPITRAELEEALGWLCQAAKRQFPCVGTTERPTGWDVRHREIDRRLCEWEAARE